MKYEKIKLSDLVETVSDTRKINKDKVVLINTSDIFDGDVLNHSYTDNSNLRGQFKKRFEKNDILYSEIRPANKRFAYVDFDSEDYIASTKLMVLRKKSNSITNKFLYYCLTNDFFTDKMQHLAEARSGTFPQITFDVLKNESINVPSIENQNKITMLLDNISNKIKSNNEINNNLLQLCRYKYDELNKKYDDWDLVKINDLNLEVTDYVANGSFKSLADNVTLYDDKEYALYVRNADLKVNFTDKRKYVDQKSYEFLKKSKLKGGELIISNVGDVGSVFICPHLNMPMTLGSNVIMLYETDSHYYNYFLYFFFTSVYGQYMIGGITGGSAQPKFNKTDFRNMKIKFPAFDELDKFNAEIDPIYKKYELNIKENEKLSELRDTLLPKLMNGEIDLDNIEI
jgi:type I restriction enzyme, S subunit